MTFRHPGRETKAERLARLFARVEGKYVKLTDSKNENIHVTLKRIKDDLDQAVHDEVFGGSLRFSLLLRADALLIDVHGMDDDVTFVASELSDQAREIERVALEIVNAYNWSNPIASWDYRFHPTVRVLSEREQWALRNAVDLIDVRPYPY